MVFEDHYLRSGEKVTIPVAQGYSDVFKLIKSDVFRVRGKIYRTSMLWGLSFSSANLKYLFWLRMAGHKGLLYPLSLIIHKIYTALFSCHIYAGTHIGYGFYIGHAFSTMVSKHCIIGNNVNISQLSNFGTNDGNGPVICDNTYIGPMTCLVGDVQIGHNSIVGAGSIVTKDIPCNTTAVGNPAKVIGENRHPEYVGNRFIY